MNPGLCRSGRIVWWADAYGPRYRKIYVARLVPAMHLQCRGDCRDQGSVTIHTDRVHSRRPSPSKPRRPIWAAARLSPLCLCGKLAAMCPAMMPPLSAAICHERATQPAVQKTSELASFWKWFGI